MSASMREPCALDTRAIARASPLRRRGGWRRCRSPVGQVLGPHRAAVGARHQNAAAVDRRLARPATRPRARSRTGAGSAASARRGRTCRAGSPTSMAPPKRGRASQAELQVADDRLARDEELVHERCTTGPSPPGRWRRGAEPLLGLGTDREVVVDHGHLPVEQEVGVGRVGLEPGEQVVEQVDEPQPERLERRVPLAVPVGVRDHGHSPRHTATLPTARWSDVGRRGRSLSVDPRRLRHRRGDSAHRWDRCSPDRAWSRRRDRGPRRPMARGGPSGG